MRAKPPLTQMRRGRLPAPSCRHVRMDGPERPSGRNASPSGITPSHIMSPAPEPTRGSRTEVRLGARAHKNRCPTNRAHAPPTHTAVQPRQPPTTRLTCGPCTSKEGRGDDPLSRRVAYAKPLRVARVVVTRDRPSGRSGSGNPIMRSRATARLLFANPIAACKAPGEAKPFVRRITGVDSIS